MKKIIFFLYFINSISCYCQIAGNGVSDIEGNNYNSLIIGSQEWQKENLNVSKYSDGTPIPQITDPVTWRNLTTGAWCYYNHSTSNGIIYGKLYNWYAVAGIYDTASFNNPSLRKQLAPNDWHIPTQNEWITLKNFLGNNAGAQITQIGSVLWPAPNSNATNSSGFTALPGGILNSRPDVLGDVYGFELLAETGFWWSSTEQNDWVFGAQNASVWYSGGNLDFYDNSGNYPYKSCGVSVRCLKNGNLNNQNISISNFKIYPNPSNGFITIKVVDYNSNLTYTLIDLLGQKLLNGCLNEQYNHIDLLNTKQKGLYFIKIFNKEELLKTEKVLVY